MSEPEFTNLQFDWILGYFTNNDPSKIFIFQLGELEENIKSYASIFKIYSNKLLLEFEDWWIPAHEYRLKQWEKIFNKSPIDAFEEIHKYLDTKKK